MLINNKEIDINAITKDIFDDKDMIKNKGNGIYLSDNQINVLKRYNIDYKKYNSIKSLIFEIENILNEETDLEDLEAVSESLAEINYYNNTNK
ncbi:MAG TPA: hypothetical protein IAB68_05525 [Candidatus Aphodocola excrementigallinarum]|uniref:Uncharacterized protein n=1 Tax=Candidatus Aphodocola excrementigallinarum TaxID=2840670 RepID=A0A9D1IQ76_9FIRM|nr:hypothetical protein [Candidatus Aphodocola excrementigallinarum]